MNIVRAVIRRGFRVRPAGNFTVLEEDTWSAASRLREHPSNRIHLSQTALEQERKPTFHSGSHGQSTVHLDLTEPGVQNRNPLRLLLIVLVAAAITCSLLWWLFFVPSTLIPYIP